MNAKTIITLITFFLAIVSGFAFSRVTESVGGTEVEQGLMMVQAMSLVCLFGILAILGVGNNESKY